MFAGWKAAGAIGVSALVALGVQQMRVMDRDGEIERQARQLDGLTRDRDEAIASADNLKEELRFLRRVRDFGDRIAAQLDRQQLTLSADIGKALREARNAPVTLTPGCPDLHPAHDLWLDWLQSIEPGRADGGDQGRAGGGAAAGAAPQMR